MGVPGYQATPGNRGVWMLRRDVGELTEFVMFTLWDSIDSVKAFAGEDVETAIFYAEDDRFLVERERHLLPLRGGHARACLTSSGLLGTIERDLENRLPEVGRQP